jgi:NAD(P)-dependent dehydrogenase (short-subunit alcohol dehydrogenase family)
MDVLINNAGGMFGRRQLIADGIEMTFALNHLAYFSLTTLLMPSLRAAERARIVNVASDAHFGIELDFDDLQSERRYSGWRAYKRSKLCNRP